MADIIDRLLQIELDMLVYYNMSEEESEKLLNDILEYANNNRDSMIALCRSFKPHEDCMLNVIYEALALDIENWGEFFAEEVNRIIELAKKSDKPFAVTDCLEEMVCEESNLPFVDKIIRTLEKELESPIDALRHRSVDLLSWWIDDSNIHKYQTVIYKMKLLLKDKNWKIRWMTHQALTVHLELKDKDILLSPADMERGEKGNGYNIEEEKEEDFLEFKEGTVEKKIKKRRDLLVWPAIMAIYLSFKIYDNYQITLIDFTSFTCITLLCVAVAAAISYKHYQNKGFQDKNLLIITAAGSCFGTVPIFLFLMLNNSFSEETNAYIDLPVINYKHINEEETIVTLNWEGNLKNMEVIYPDTANNKKSIRLVKKEGWLGIPVIAQNTAQKEAARNARQASEEEKTRQTAEAEMRDAMIKAMKTKALQDKDSAK
ncbi:MAG: hypothetical protein ACKOXB_04135 [Flavobacteriales bacterium]